VRRTGPFGLTDEGAPLSYDRCPRANIFRRDQAKVNALADMQHLMTYNDFLHGLFSRSASNRIRSSL
jgi:hypothetical protein